MDLNNLRFQTRMYYPRDIRSIYKITAHRPEDSQEKPADKRFTRGSQPQVRFPLFGKQERSFCGIAVIIAAMAAVARIPFYTRGISHSPAARSSVAPPFYQKLQVQRKFDTVSRSQTTGGIHQVSGLRPMCLSEYRSSVLIRVPGRVPGRLGLDLGSEWSRLC